MSTASINTKIKLDGEREYKAALSEIGAGLKELKSEMNLSAAAFRDNADSVEALTKKGDILERTILTQKEKISVLERALASSAEAYGEADKRTSDWKTALNNAQTELLKMEQALRENAEAIEKVEKENNKATSTFGKLKQALSDTKAQGGGVKTAFKNLREEFPAVNTLAQGLGDTITDLAGELGIELPGGVQKAISSLNGISTSAAVAATGVGLAVAAIVKAEKSLISMTKEAAENASEIIDLSAVSGMATSTVQEYDYAAGQIGVSSERIRDSLKEITNKMQEVQQGNEDTTEAFANLGVMIFDTDGKLRDSEDVFRDTVDALSKIENRTERDALAMDLMSESAQELNPLIDAGSEALDKYAEEARKMGYVLDADALNALNDVDDAYQRLQKTQDTIKKQMSAEFAPYLEDFYEKMTTFIKQLGNTVDESGLVDAFGMLLNTFMDILVPADTLSNDTLPKLTVALRPLAEVLALVADALDLIQGVGKILFSWGLDKLEGWAQVSQALGANYAYGNGNNYQTLKDTYQQKDINAATEAAGYGQYYANGKWYENYDIYLHELWEDALKNGPTGSFEAWKAANGYARNASGADYYYGGRTLLSENGAEMAILPQGTRILTAQETREVGGDTWYITIDAKNVQEFNDIVRLAQAQRRVSRMEGK